MPGVGEEDVIETGGCRAHSRQRGDFHGSGEERIHTAACRSRPDTALDDLAGDGLRESRQGVRIDRSENEDLLSDGGLQFRGRAFHDHSARIDDADL